MSDYEMQKEGSDRYSLRGRVFNTIRENILSGKYKQHEELKENTIAQELGVSRTPVREALRQLELEELVSIVPNKGAYVTGITEKDMKDIYVARSLLEGRCTRWAAENITLEQVKELEENLELSEFYSRKKNYAQVCELDTRFHELLYHASNSRMLNHLLSDFHHYVERVRRLSLATEGRALKSNEEHRRILHAIIAGDTELAENLATEHVLNTLKNIDSYGIDNLLKASDLETQQVQRENGILKNL